MSLSGWVAFWVVTALALLALEAASMGVTAIVRPVAHASEGAVGPG